MGEVQHLLGVRVIGCVIWFFVIAIAAGLWSVPAVGPFLSLALIGSALWLTKSMKKSAELSRPQTSVGLSSDLLQTASPSLVADGIPVVGTSYYSGWGQKRGTGQVALVREPRNPHDRNAIAVIVHGKQIGHLPKERAAVLAPVLDAEGRSRVTASASFGDRQVRVELPGRVQLDLSPSEEALSWPELEPWGRCIHELDIDFEQDHRTEVAALFAAQKVRLTAAGEVLDGLDALIVPGQTSTAPAVVIEGQWVGNITDPGWSGYGASLRAVWAAQKVLKVRARVWARNDRGVVRSSVRVYMPEASEIYAPGPMPSGVHVLLPPGRKVQVTGEEMYLDEVAPLLKGSGSQAVVATLHIALPATARASKERVEVRVYGAVVGTLTPHMSDQFLPLLKACAEEGVTVACRALVKGNQLKADVELDAMRAGDLDDEWISAHVYGSVLQQNPDLQLSDQREQSLHESPTKQRPADMWEDD